MNGFIRLMPKFLQTLTPYESPREGISGKTAWLNSNEYPEPTAYAMRFDTLNRYPEVQPRIFCERYATYAGVQPRSVLVTRGADEAIELLIRTFCEPGKDRVLYMLSLRCSLTMPARNPSNWLFSAIPIIQRVRFMRPRQLNVSCNPCPVMCCLPLMKPTLNFVRR